jgi:radical SAM protein with 4Fe4S-binding SPASM domain
MIADDQRAAAAAAGEASVTQRLRRAATNRAVLVEVLLELTKRCNLHCQHCYVTQGPSELSTSQVLRLLDQAADLGCMMVTLTGGEIMLRTDWLTVAAAVRERRMSLNVFTNGTLLEWETAAKLAELKPIFVGVSLYAPHAPIHDAVTGVAGSFERSVRAIRMLRSLGARVQVKNVLMNINAPFMLETEDLAKSMGCEYAFDPTVGPKANGDQSVLVHRVHGETLFNFYRDLASRKPEMLRESPVKVEALAGEAHNCSAGFVSLTIEADGSAYPCMGLPPSWGDVRDMPLGEIWQGPEAERFRGVMKRPLVQCSQCDDRAYCSFRCPRLALVEDGDALGLSSRACELAKVARRVRETSSSQEVSDRLAVESGGEVTLYEEGVREAVYRE